MGIPRRGWRIDDSSIGAPTHMRDHHGHADGIRWNALTGGIRKPHSSCRVWLAPVTQAMASSMGPSGGVATRIPYDPGAMWRPMQPYRSSRPSVEAAPCRSPGLAGDASIGVGAGSPARAHLLLPGARKFTDLVDVAPVAPGTRRWGGRSMKESQEDTRDNPVVTEGSIAHRLPKGSVWWTSILQTGQKQW